MPISGARSEHSFSIACGRGMALVMPGAKGKTINENAAGTVTTLPAGAVTTLPAATRARTYAGAAALKGYRFRKGVSGNPSGMSRFYYQCRKIFQENSPELARAAIELALDPDTDQRVRSVLIVAGLDRAGVKPMDYDPAQDVTPPSWDPGALTPEERENLKAYLVKMVRKAKP